MADISCPFSTEIEDDFESTRPGSDMAKPSSLQMLLPKVFSDTRMSPRLTIPHLDL